MSVPYSAKTHRGSAAATRKTAHQRGYGSDWQRLRDAYIRNHPLCELCLKLGLTVPGEDVDHVTPHRGNDGLRLCWENLQTLCKHCHGLKTWRENH